MAIDSRLIPADFTPVPSLDHAPKIIVSSTLPDDVEVVGGCVRRCGGKLRCRPRLGQLRGLTRSLEFSELATGERCRSGHGDRRHGTGPPGSFRRRAVPTGTGFITKR